MWLATYCCFSSVEIVCVTTYPAVGFTYVEAEKVVIVTQSVLKYSHVANALAYASESAGFAKIELTRVVAESAIRVAVQRNQQFDLSFYIARWLE